MEAVERILRVDAWINIMTNIVIWVDYAVKGFCIHYYFSSFLESRFRGEGSGKTDLEEKSPGKACLREKSPGRTGLEKGNPGKTGLGEESLGKNGPEMRSSGKDGLPDCL